MKLEHIDYNWDNDEINDKLNSLITSAEVIQAEDFEDLSDLSFLLDEDESFSDYIAQDEDSIMFQFEYNGERFTGMKTLAMTDLFSESGEIPDLKDVEIEKSVQELNMDSLAWVLAPINSPDSFKKAGEESLNYNTSKVRSFVNEFENSARYQLLSKGKPIAAIYVKDNEIDAIYTSAEFRRKGLGRKLAMIAKNDFPELRHSDSSTAIGAKFISGVDFDKEQDSGMSY